MNGFPYPAFETARLVRVEPAAFVDPRCTEHEVWELGKAEWSERVGASAR